MVQETMTDRDIYKGTAYAAFGLLVTTLYWYEGPNPSFAAWIEVFGLLAFAHVLLGLIIGVPAAIGLWREQRLIKRLLIPAPTADGGGSQPIRERDEAHALFHELWSTARHGGAYDKAKWSRLAQLILDKQ